MKNGDPINMETLAALVSERDRLAAENAALAGALERTACWDCRVTGSRDPKDCHPEIDHCLQAEALSQLSARTKAVMEVFAAGIELIDDEDAAPITGGYSTQRLRKALLALQALDGKGDA